PDDGDGHGRRTRRRDRGSDPLSRRRADRQGPDRRDCARRRRGDGGVHRAVRGIALRALWARKLRTTLTALAIVLGIATISGTFVLTDSISHAFNTIFTSIYRGTDAVITGKSAISKDATTDLPPFDESLLSTIRALPDVQ